MALQEPKVVQSWAVISKNRIILFITHVQLDLSEEELRGITGADEEYTLLPSPLWGDSAITVWMYSREIPRLPGEAFYALSEADKASMFPKTGKELSEEEKAHYRALKDEEAIALMNSLRLEEVLDNQGTAKPPEKFTSTDFYKHFEW